MDFINAKSEDQITAGEASFVLSVFVMLLAVGIGVGLVAVAEAGVLFACLAGYGAASLFTKFMVHLGKWIFEEKS